MPQEQFIGRYPCFDAMGIIPLLPQQCTLAIRCLLHTWCQIDSLPTCSRQVCCATSPMPQAGARPSAAQAARLAQLHWQPPLRVQETLPYLKGSSGGESNTTHLYRAFGLLAIKLQVFEHKLMRGITLAKHQGQCCP